MPTKLPDDVQQRLKDVMEREVRPRFAHLERWQSAAARAIGVNQSTINRLMGTPPRGGSHELVKKLAEYVNIDAGEIYGGSSVGGERIPRARDLPGYQAAMELARVKIASEGRNISDWALEKAGDFKSIPPLTDISAEMLIAVALSFMKDPELVRRHSDPEKK